MSYTHRDREQTIDDIYLQMEETVMQSAEERASIRSTLQNQLRTFLETDRAPGYLSNKYPETVLPGSVAILPIASAPIEDISYWPSQNEMSYTHRNREQTVDDIYLQTNDDEMTVEEARMSAA